MRFSFPDINQGLFTKQEGYVLGSPLAQRKRKPTHGMNMGTVSSRCT